MWERELDGRADVYSLGCVLFELLTGEPIFRGASSMNVLAQHLSADPRVKVRWPDVAPELVRLLERLLAKERDERPATAVALVVAFHDLASSSGESAAGPSIKSPAASSAASADPSAASDASEADRAVTEARKVFGRGVLGGEGAESVLALARVLAEKAIALEPSHVPAMAVLADIVLCRGLRGFADEKESIAAAERIRLAAAAIDDNVGELQSSIGVMRLYWQDDYHGAGRYLERGAELSPNDGSAQRYYSAWLKMAGRFDEALERVERAVALMPDSPHAFVGLADTLMSMGRYVEAIAPLKQALRILPRYPQAMERLEMAAHRAGRIDEAYSSRRSLLGTQRLFARLDLLTEVMEKDGWDAATTCGQGG